MIQGNRLLLELLVDLKLLAKLSLHDMLALLPLLVQPEVIFMPLVLFNALNFILMVCPHQRVIIEKLLVLRVPFLFLVARPDIIVELTFLVIIPNKILHR